MLAMSMRRMFRRNCRLEYVNLSDWDVSNTKDVREMFQHCRNLKVLDITNWNLNPLATLSTTFENVKDVNIKCNDERTKELMLKY